MQLTGMTVGGVTVFSLPEGKLSPELFRRLPNARIVPGLALERRA
ncbi:MAG: hypothetical protein ACE5JN_00205 [Candidatus Methylomirabilia bacterium]